MLFASPSGCGNGTDVRLRKERGALELTKFRDQIIFAASASASKGRHDNPSFQGCLTAYDLYHTYDNTIRKMVIREIIKIFWMVHMPPKLEDETKRLNMVAPASWVKKIDDWRRQQPDLPNISEAIRRLVDLGLDASKKLGKPSR
ncbi:hypothetical protein SAMN05216573_12147 [Bradyrhizobium sp. Rc3b]|uniref:hypothetical protein n=1 Tax=Bradyrhizobium sp. Rc3b TaxID=1855322 RepID=UPI0008E18203|nr:hypothetical protein [Bradyrhizobium sp. Rc3b]SFN77715.1 hypothetical protein SAMN05216573_12147 [Bradyrhizobium sp. Rc3b]